MGPRHSEWFRRARFDDGLLIPGRPRKTGADLRLTSHEVELVHGSRSATLRWSDQLSRRHPHAEGSDGWTFVPWSGGNGGPIGIAIGVDGVYVESTADIRASTRTLWNRFDQWFLRRDAAAVPLYAKWLISRTVEADLDVTQALCTLLSERPDVRRHLDDRTRVTRLLTDMKATRVRVVPRKTGGRRTTVETLTAMRALGYEHQFLGRPLPGEDLIDTDEVTRRVVENLRASPYARDIPLDDERIRSTVGRHYASVEPWPFAALLEG